MGSGRPDLLYLDLGKEQNTELYTVCSLHTGSRAQGRAGRRVKPEKTREVKITTVVVITVPNLFESFMTYRSGVPYTQAKDRYYQWPIRNQVSSR